MLNVLYLRNPNQDASNNNVDVLVRKDTVWFDLVRGESPAGFFTELRLHYLVLLTFGLNSSLSTLSQLRPS